MPDDTRAIVICCDGTFNNFGEHNTNVRRVFDLTEDEDKYCRYYDPGIGTDVAKIRAFKHFKSVRNWGAATVGVGIQQDVVTAYEFLTNHYTKSTSGLFLFGFSRGALTVRRLAKMLAVCGLPPKGCQNLVPHAYEAYMCYRKYERDPKINRKFLPTYKSFRDLSIDCSPAFIGVWDTVRVSGRDPRNKKCKLAKGIKCARHALSLDEKRGAFEAEIWEDEDSDRIRQRWFPGDHSDVGGGHYGKKHKRIDLSYITLEWMLEEANKSDFRVDMEQPRKDANTVRETVLAERDFVNDLSATLKWRWMRKVTRKVEDGTTHDTDREMVKWRIDLEKDNNRKQEYIERKCLAGKF